MSRMELRGLTKRFGKNTALDGIEFEVEDGSFFVLLGPSGAGKTTTLRVIAGLEKPDEGEVVFDGEPSGRTPPADRDVAMVFQSYALYPKKTVSENIASPLRARRMPEDQIKSRVGEVAELLNITDKLERLPPQLSGGQQQRVALGRALVREPRAFLMDEPLTNLDLKLRVAMRTELTRIHQALGRTFVYVTNDQVEAMSMADRIAVLNQGKIQQVGSPTEVYDRPVNRFVANFVGSVRMNMLPCEAEDGALKGPGWSLPTPQWLANHGQRRFILGARPEDLSIANGDGDGGRPTIAGSVYAVEPLGDRSIVDVEVGQQVVKVKAGPTAHFDLEETVRVGVDLERVHLFDADNERAVSR